MTALDRLRETWQQQNLAWIDKGNDRADAQAPGHSAMDRSITFRQIAGSVLMNSHADDKDTVLQAAGLTVADLYDDPKGSTYPYPDGRVVHRSPYKKFRQSGNKTGTALFRSTRLADHQSGVPVYVVEGEKDVLALESVGAVAVCSAMGAGKAKHFDWSPLTGHTVIIVADKDEPGRKHATDILEILAPITEAVVVVESPFGKDAADHIAAGKGVEEFLPVEIAGHDYGARRLRITRGSAVQTKRIHWVIPDWIPSASLTLLAGREGLGKSTIAASICASITSGTLEGELFGTPRNVLYIHTEDAREFTVAPRLRAAGADMDRVLFVDVQTDITDDGTLILPLDTLALEKVIAEHDVAFVVLDAATSSMSSELSGKDDRAVRQYLEPLSQLAARQDCVVFGLCHFGKRDGADTGKLILGSIAWSQVARSVLSVAQDEDSGHLVVTNTKGNLAPRTRSMEAHIKSVTIPTDDGDAEVGAIEWLGESSRDARELLSGPDETDGEDRTEAEKWLADFLESNGQTPGKAVKAAAGKEKIAERTLKYAAKKLGVVYVSEGFPRVSHWSLPQLGNHSQATPSHGPTGPTGPTGADLHKHDGPTVAESQLGQLGNASVHDLADGPTVEPSVFTSPRSTNQPSTESREIRLRAISGCRDCGTALNPSNHTGRCAECKLTSAVS